ncbi:MAG TPA: response regulator transcription factor [Angustibacter sp.]|nr:response regulator transcription factor [Angustibacter sp.]
MTIRVMVVDDQELVRAGFAMMIDAQDDMQVVADAADGEQALQRAAQHHPDVVMMDLRMPVLDGITATRRLVAQHPSTRVCMLTTFDLDRHVYDAIQAGASGFLLKDVRPRDLAHAIRVVADGQALVAPQVTQRLLAEFTSRPRPGQRHPSLGELTDREREVLVLMASACSNQEIADRLVLSEATVRTHVSRVLAKLGLRDRVQAVVFAYETGLVRAGAASGD